MRFVTKTTLLIAGLVAGFASSSVAPAAAKGCNGYVNQLQWGCAPWDNNNGPQFPHYVAPRAAAPVAPRAPVGLPVQPPISRLPATSGGRLITDNGGGLAPRG